MTVPASHPILPDWPADQPYIVTRPGAKFLRFIDLTRTLPHKTHYPTMAIIIGDAGLGKTYTVRHYAATPPPRRHTGLPACIVLTLERDTTKRYLTELLLRELRMVPVGRSGFPLLDQATSAILRNDLELIIVDEADFLKEDTFELLRRVFDRTGCPIVLVGLPKLLHVVHLHEKFRSRMSMIHQFLPPQRREMLTTVLEQMVLPRWQYDHTNIEDCAMGAFAWDSIIPSFRNLRTLLQVASLIAEERDAPTIQREHIAEALTLTTIPVAASTDQMAEPLQMTDSPEVLSEQRQEAKRGKRGAPRDA